jgi:signal transduction histidine kinase/AraC-like DNA-binding protein/ActR/RegA family two-component response regulator
VGGSFDKKNTYLKPKITPFASALNGKIINKLILDKNNNVWMATSNGLFKYNFKTNKLKTFSKLQGLPTNDISTIFQDQKDIIWVGTYYNGLIKYDEKLDKFTYYREKDGLAQNNIFSILADNSKSLWIATGNGLSHLDLITNRFKNYYKTDGLAGNTFNINSCYKTRQNELFFGGFNGITAFFSEKIEDNLNVPPLVIFSLKIFNKQIKANQPDKILTKDISLTTKLNLSYNQNAFTLDFASLNYIKSAKNKYTYQLKNFTKELTYTSIPSATYINVPPGTYTFVARGSNNDGIWSKPISLSITILPPWWKTWWAYLAYLLIVSGILFFIGRYFFLQSIFKRDQESTRLKLNFFTNISHEIRTHLSLIHGPVERLMMKEDKPDDQIQLQTIKRNSDSLIQLVNELMDFRKAETRNLALNVQQNNLIELVHNVYESFKDVSLSRNIKTDIIYSTEKIEIYFDWEQLKKVIFNLVSNSYKFTPNGGYIAIFLVEKATTVEIKITDNGKGIAPENLVKIFDNYFQENDYEKQNTGYGMGLALAKSITALHSGTLEAESNIFTGGQQNRTCFTLVLKKGFRHFPPEMLKETKRIRKATLKSDTNDINHLSGLRWEKSEEGDKSITILLVEDNTEIRNFIKTSLQKQYIIAESENGLAGWESAIDIIPDLIITDVMMPEMDGIAFCDKLKSDERTNHIPVIMLTAKSSAEAQINGLISGANIYVSKPFSMHILALQIANLLSLREKMHKNFQLRLKFPQDVHLINDTAPVAAGMALEPDVIPCNDVFMRKFIDLIEANIDSAKLSVPFLSIEMNMSQPVLYKKLYSITGMTVNNIIKLMRLKKGLQLLQSNQYTPQEITYMIGFTDPKYFYKEFKKQFGKTPREHFKHLQPGKEGRGSLL